MHSMGGPEASGPASPVLKENHREEIKTLQGVKIIFGVAVINLVVLGSELAMNVIRTAFG